MTPHPDDRHDRSRPETAKHDTGNEMNERAGHYDESESGRTETPTGGAAGKGGTRGGRSNGAAVPASPHDPDGSETSFDGGDAVPGR